MKFLPLLFQPTKSKYSFINTPRTLKAISDWIFYTYSIMFEVIIPFCCFLTWFFLKSTWENNAWLYETSTWLYNYTSMEIQCNVIEFSYDKVEIRPLWFIASSHGLPLISLNSMDHFPTSLYKLWQNLKCRVKSTTMGKIDTLYTTKLG